MIIVQSCLNTRDRPFGYLVEKNELSLGQRVHLHKRELIFVFNNIYYILGIFIVILFVIIALALNAESFIENFGEWEYRFHSIDGIHCEPNKYNFKTVVDY